MKKNLILKFMVPALMLGVITTAFAADVQPPSDKTSEQRSEALKKQREEFKNLTPEERAAKRKEARAKMEKRLAELQKKKADGAITEKEQKQLDRLETIKNNQGKPNAPRTHKKANPAKPASEEKSQ